MVGAAVATSHRARRSRGAGQLALLACLLAAGAAVGALSARKPAYAAGLVVAVAVVLLVARNVRALPPILVATVFTEAVSVGGLTVGRLVGVVALAVLAYYLLAGGKADLGPSWLLAVGLATGFWILLSSYWAASSHFVVVTFFQWALSAAFMLVFAILVRTETQLRAVLLSVVVSSVVFGAVGFVASVGATVAGRASGLAGDPNLFATYQALAVPAALVLAAGERRPHRRAALYAAIVVDVVTIAVSFSRGGLITLGVVVGLTILAPWHVFFRRQAQKVSYLLTIAAAGWVVAILGSTAYLDRIRTIFNGEGRGSGRTDLWAAALNAYSHHPALGLGAGGFEANSLTYLHDTPGVDIRASYVAAGRPVHNAYLESLVDLGPIGLALLAALLGLTLWYLGRSALRFRAGGEVGLQRVTLALIAALLGLVVSMIFLSIELGKPIWIFAGLALATDRMSSPARGRADSAVPELTAPPLRSAAR